jgi:hypothetical protein
VCLCKACGVGTPSSPGAEVGELQDYLWSGRREESSIFDGLDELSAGVPERVIAAFRVDQNGRCRSAILVFSHYEKFDLDRSTYASKWTPKTRHNRHDHGNFNT